MTSWQHYEVEERADAILAGARTAESYAEHFETQMRAARFRARRNRGLLTLLRAIRRLEVIMLAHPAIRLRGKEPR